MFSFFRRKKKPENPTPEEQAATESAVVDTPAEPESASEAPAAVEVTAETATPLVEPAAVIEETADAAAELQTEVQTAADVPAATDTVSADTAAAPIDQPIETVTAETVQLEEAPAPIETETAAAPVAQPLETVVMEAIAEPEATPATAETEIAVHTDTPAVVETPEPTPPAVATPQAEESTKLGWAARLKQGLTKSRDKMAKSLAGVFGGGKIDEDLYEELETVLITSDMGMEATEYLMKDVRNRVSLKGLKDGEELRGALKDAIYDLIKPLEQPLVLPERGEPFVIMLAGINGAGKTTSIGKLAKYFQSQGKSVLLAAGDTFRAAAREQLQEWGQRNNVTVISQSTGDSAAVCFDAVQAAKARGIDIVLADTAGRLPTQLHLMEEIKKVKRVLQKAMPDAPHEIIVVLDANIGQNAVNQVKAFDDALGLTGLIVTKLDGTAKGGILAALASDRPVPVRYIGVGEGIDDLRPFDARAFVDALLD